MYVAQAYLDGDGVEQDSEEAARWYRAAAQAGHMDAPVHLGMMYANLEADMDADPDAERFLEIAADAGYPSARYLLAALRDEEDDEFDDPGEFGDLDDFGGPGPEEMREITEDLLREAWSGDADAQFEVALAYHLGLGVPRDEEEAIRWFRAAAIQGDSAAMNNLGVMHYHGEGVPAPDHEAALSHGDQVFQWRRGGAGRKGSREVAAQVGRAG